MTAKQILEQLIEEFPQFLLGDDGVNGADLVDFVSEMRQRFPEEFGLSKERS